MMLADLARSISKTACTHVYYCTEGLLNGIVGGVRIDEQPGISEKLLHE